jgi:hypothetical protein
MRRSRTTTRLAAALGAAVSFWAGAAGAQAPGGAADRPPLAQAQRDRAGDAPAAVSILCQWADYGRLAQHLAARFGERPVALGAAEDAAGPGGAVTVVFASAGGATWTLVHLWPDGSACVAASGANWEIVPAPPAGEAS